MSRFNTDTLLAIFLLLVCGVLMTASFDIREPDYGQLSPATWPRIIIGVMSLLCVIYLLQSLRKPQADADKQSAAAQTAPESFFAYWRNVIWCFSLFFLYLLALPWLGMLVGGVGFVFLLLNALGGWSPKQLLLQAAVALVSVGGMWVLFTFGLGVLLPEGELGAMIKSALRQGS